MRPFARSAILFLAFASLTLAQDEPDPFLAERILPPNPLVFLSIPQSATISQDFAKSNLAKMLQHPEIQSFLAPFQAWSNKRKTQPTQGPGGASPSLNEMSRGMTGLSIDEFIDILQGPFAAALYDIPVGPEHKLDFVLTLGSPDATKLEKAAATLKKTFVEQSGLQEGEFARNGVTIREFGDKKMRIYYALVRKTLLIASRQERIEQLVDDAAAPKAAGLSEDPAFKAARARVASENRHFFLLYANLAQVTKQFRRELGDEALRILETLGLTDVPSIAMAMGYDGPHIRERYALMTSRQDRGLVKFIAGGAPADPYVSLVPAGAISYSHMGLNLAEFYDTIRSATKINPDFDRGIDEMLGQYEKRAGFQLRAALSTVGSTWTSWSSMPEGGGLWPDSVSAVGLTDPAAFESAVEKAAKDGGFPLEDLTFHGQKIRYISFPLQNLFGAMQAAVPDFFTFTTTFCWFIKDKTLFLANHPMTLKRVLLRAETKAKSILEDPKYISVASKFPAGDVDSRMYLDLGRLVVIGYGLAEPFLHLVRDMARDEAGEPFIDLARLPLEETLADLIGPTLTTKKTVQDAILLESRSNTGVSASTGVGYVAAVGAFAGVFFMRMSGGPGGPPGGITGNEMIAELSLQFVRNAEDTFKNSDSDANGVADFWTRDVAGLHSLKDRSGQAIFLLDPATAAADPDGAARYGLTPAPKNGYFYKMMTSDADGNVYQKDEGKTNKTSYGVVAYPATYGGTGRFTFITSEAGKTWKKDTEGKPVGQWPGKDPSKEGWTLVE